MNADWVQALRARADLPPSKPREPLFIEAAAPAVGPIGSIEPPLARRMAEAGLPIAAGPLGWRITGASANDALAALAAWLRDQGLASVWRNELLRVADAAGSVGGAIERAAVRPLGIATHAVHLVGRAEQGGVWVQQRAFDKATDPGCWDTLMGGLISADESIPSALERETWEEAGLRVTELRELRERGTLTVRRPVERGYMIEHIRMFDALIPAPLVPLNQDGEVAAFERLDRTALRERLRAGAFTLEAALILIDVLELRERG
ncbi:MAG TPA: NUDIX domain-containing protein [Burkholderiaceae bacterium]|jgi:8-oxo-dGTP pyrophosphatase MutT (NUDIX family)